MANGLLICIQWLWNDCNTMNGAQRQLGEAWKWTDPQRPILGSVQQETDHESTRKQQEMEMPMQQNGIMLTVMILAF